MSDKKSIWNDAGRAGLVLGGVSVLYLISSSLLSKYLTGSTGAIIAANIINVFLWIIKFGGCIWLMRFFMRKYDCTLKFGSLTAFFSALIYSAFYLAFFLYIEPDMFESVIETLAQNPMMDSNALQALDELKPKMPSYLFFSNLIYCWLFGTIVAAFVSSHAASSNPFNDDEADD